MRIETSLRLPLIKLDDTVEENKTFPLKGFSFDDEYIILTEILDTSHYILLCVRTGKVMSGMYEMWRFREATQEDISVEIKL